MVIYNFSHLTIYF